MIPFELARNIASFAHKGQVDKAGNPYINHIRSVSGLLYGEEDYIRIAAELHDIVEDTEFTCEKLREFRVPEESIEIIRLVTRDKSDGKTYLEWIQSIVDSGNIGAMKVKYADNLHNSLPWRICSLEKKEQSIIKRYERARKILEDGIMAYYENIKHDGRL